MNPTGDHRDLPLRNQARITWERYPILVVSIVATWVVIVVLAVAAGIAIGRTNGNASRIESNGQRSEQAICAIKDYTDQLSSRSSRFSDPQGAKDLKNLSVRLGHLVHCVGAKPASDQPNGN